MVYHIYCDESRQSKDRFMVIGGVILPSTNVNEFNQTMQQFRFEQKMFAELKWTKVTDQKLPQYKRSIEYFFALNNTDKLHFHCIVLDNHRIDHRKFSKGDKELGFYKFYYQLLLNCFGRWYCRQGENDRFIVHLDYRTTTYSLNILKIVLNRGMKKKFGIGSSPIVSIEPRQKNRAATNHLYPDWCDWIPEKRLRFVGRFKKFKEKFIPVYCSKSRGKGLERKYTLGGKAFYDMEFSITKIKMRPNSLGSFRSYRLAVSLASPGFSAESGAFKRYSDPRANTGNPRHWRVMMVRKSFGNIH